MDFQFSLFDAANSLVDYRTFTIQSLLIFTPESPDPGFIKHRFVTSS